MGATPPIDSSDMKGSATLGDVSSDVDGKRNTAAKARAGKKYQPEPRPKDIQQLIDTINMWGFYIRCWGDRVHEELHELDLKIDELNARTRATTHLDPPPEPYDPPPT